MYKVASWFFDNGEAKTEIFTESEFCKLPEEGTFKDYDVYIDTFDTLEECDKYIASIK